MAKLNKKWRLQELVPKSVYQTYKENAIRFLDPRLPTLLLQLNYICNTRLIVNTWHHEEDGFQERGFRTSGSTVGATLSQHRHGRAADITSLDIDIRSCYETILSENKYLRDFGLSRVCVNEDRNYIHLDLAWTGTEQLIILPKDFLRKSGNA